MNKTRIKIISFICFIILFAYANHSEINKMSSSSINDFLDDLSTCSSIDNEKTCLTTGKNLKNKGTVESKCCGYEVNGDSGCINLSINDEVKDYILNILSNGENIVNYSCDETGEKPLIPFNLSKADYTYEKINREIGSALSAASKEECFKKADNFKVANGCCFFDYDNYNYCTCFSEGIKKNELDVFLNIADIGKDKIKNLNLKCKEKSGEKEGTYEKLFEASNLIRFDKIKLFLGIITLILLI